MVLVLGALCAWAMMIAAGRREPLISNRWNVGLIVFGFAVLAVVTVATANIEVVDRAVYLKQMEFLDVTPAPWDSEYFSGDPLFVVLLWLLARVAPATEVVLYAVIATAVAVGYLIALRRLLPAWGVLGAWVTLLATGLFFSYTGVAARQGLALACLMVAVAMLATRKGTTRWFVALLVAASLLHWTAVPLALGLMVLWRWQPTVKAAVSVWVVLAAAFVAGIPERLLGGLPLEGLDKYTALSAYDAYGTSGLRFDFLAVSALFLLVGLAGLRYANGDPVQRRLVVAYVLFNSLFLLLGFVAFSDRLASYSWFLVPMLLWYPLTARDSKHGVLMSAGTVGTMIVAGLIYGPLAQLA